MTPNAQRERFEKYIKLVSSLLKSQSEDKLAPHEIQLIELVESDLSIDDPKAFRDSLLARVASAQIGQNDTPVDLSALFAHDIERLDEVYYAANKKRLAEALSELLDALTHQKFDEELMQRKDRMHVLGYNEASLGEAIVFSQLLNAV